MFITYCRIQMESNPMGWNWSMEPVKFSLVGMITNSAYTLCKLLPEPRHDWAAATLAGLLPVSQYLGIDIGIGILFWNSRYWYWYWHLLWKSQVLVLVLVSFLKMCSIGIVIGIEFGSLKYWYRYWYRILVLQDEISVSFISSQYRASMSHAKRRVDILPFPSL